MGVDLLSSPTFPGPTSLCEPWGQVPSQAGGRTSSLVSQELSRVGLLPAAVAGYGDGGWVSAGGCSPEELSSPLASVRVGVCTRTDSQNKPVPVWEISVKSVFCKSWPGSCFHITNQKQLDVFLGASAFPNPFMALSLPLEMERTCSRASVEVCQQLTPFGGAGHHIIGWPRCDCRKKGRKNLCWGVRTSLLLVLTRKE